MFKCLEILIKKMIMRFLVGYHWNIVWDLSFIIIKKLWDIWFIDEIFSVFMFK